MSTYPVLQFISDLSPLLTLVGALFAAWKGYWAIQETKASLIKEQTTKEVEARAALQSFKEKVEERMTGFNVALEKGLDKAVEDCKTLEGKIESFQHLDKDVTRLQTTIDSTSSRVERLEGSVEKLGDKIERTSQWQNSILNEILLNLNGGSVRKLPNL